MWPAFSTSGLWAMAPCHADVRRRPALLGHAGTCGGRASGHDCTSPHTAAAGKFADSAAPVYRGYAQKAAEGHIGPSSTIF